jgi:hypothetical protein
MTQITRRVFMMRSLAGGCAALAAPALVHAAAHVEESDEVAQSLGYRHDTKQVDDKRFPKHQASQHCASCSFFQGAPADEWGGCAMFGRKQISANGWCSAWASK